MKFISIAYPIVILIDVIVFFNFWQWHQQSIYEFEQRQMDLQVNYSVDASVHDMLVDGTHLGTDYATWGEMNTEPKVALNTYVAVLLRNFGWADTEQNRNDLINSSIPFFCVATYDGYYMYCRQQDVYNFTYVDNHGQVVTDQAMHFPMIWSPKIPYVKTTANLPDRYPGETDEQYNTRVQNMVLDGTLKSKSYMYDMGFEYCNIVDENGNLEVHKALSKTGVSDDSVNAAKLAINNTLTDACNSALYLGLEGQIDKSWYLPASFSTWSNNNPVESPTVLTYISRSDGRTRYDTVTFGIGGAKIDDAVFCICYTDGGEKLYTWSTNRDALDALHSNGWSDNHIEHIYTTAKEAAENGYFFDLRFREAK